MHSAWCKSRVYERMDSERVLWVHQVQETSWSWRWHAWARLCCPVESAQAVNMSAWKWKRLIRWFMLRLKSETWQTYPNWCVMLRQQDVYPPKLTEADKKVSERPETCDSWCNQMQHAQVERCFEAPADENFWDPRDPKVKVVHWGFVSHQALPVLTRHQDIELTDLHQRFLNSLMAADGTADCKGKGKTSKAPPPPKAKGDSACKFVYSRDPVQRMMPSKQWQLWATISIHWMKTFSNIEIIVISISVISMHTVCNRFQAWSSIKHWALNLFWICVGCILQPGQNARSAERLQRLGPQIRRELQTASPSARCASSEYPVHETRRCRLMQCLGSSLAQAAARGGLQRFPLGLRNQFASVNMKTYENACTVFAGARRLPCAPFEHIRTVLGTQSISNNSKGFLYVSASLMEH